MQEWQQRPTKGLFLFSRPSLQVLATQRSTEGLVLRSCAHRGRKLRGITTFHTAFSAGNWVKATGGTEIKVCSVPSLRQDVSNGCTTALRCWPAATNHLRPPCSPLCLPLVWIAQHSLFSWRDRLTQLHYSTNHHILSIYVRAHAHTLWTLNLRQLWQIRRLKCRQTASLVTSWMRTWWWSCNYTDVSF